MRYSPKLHRLRSDRARKMALRRWEIDRQERKAGEAERMAEIAAHPPVRSGDAVGSLEYRDYRTGKVRRWTVLHGERRDQVALRAPDGRRTNSHGWTWILNHLRGFLAGTKP